MGRISDVWVDDFRSRVYIAIAFATLIFGLLSVRLFQLQVLDGDHYRLLGKANASHQEWLPAQRGRVFDRNGETLATNVLGYDIVVDPQEVTKPTLVLLAQLLGEPLESVEPTWSRVEKYKERKWAEMIVAYQDPGARDVSLILSEAGRNRAALVEQEAYRLPGVHIRVSPHRHYPHGELAAHVLGYVGQLREDEYEQCKFFGCIHSQYIGRQGIELLAESLLRGHPGIRRYATDANSRELPDSEARLFVEGEMYVPPRGGQDLYLTLDAELQAEVETAIGSAAAAVVVMDVKTGELLAIASKPSFPPNFMSGRVTDEEYADLMNDPRHPFSDKTLQLHYSPGSTFKFVTALAALKAGVVTPSETHFCPGYHQVGQQKFRCTSHHDHVDLSVALQRSCNVYFWKLAEEVGMETIAEVAKDFGFGTPTMVALNVDRAGIIPSKSLYEKRGGHNVGHTLNMSTGQGDVSVTVVQMAVAYAALANGGKILRPRIIRRRKSDNFEFDYMTVPNYVRTVDVSKDDLDSLRQGMVWAVHRQGGTAYRLGRPEGIVAAGKTGTAQVRSKTKDRPNPEEPWHPHRDHAWFAGYAPADDPEIAVVVLVEHGGSGGKIAAPIAKKVLEAWKERREVND